MDKTLTQEKQPWSKMLYQNIEDRFNSLKEEIDHKVGQLKKADLFIISNERNKLTDKYAQFYRVFFQIMTSKNAYTTTFFHDLICQSLVAEGQRLESNPAEIDYFFNHNFSNFIEQLKKEHRHAFIQEEKLKEREGDKHKTTLKLQNFEQFESITKDEVLKYIAELLGRWKACQYTYNVVKNDGVYKAEKKINRTLLDPIEEEATSKHLDQDSLGETSSLKKNKSSKKDYRTGLGAAAIAMYYILDEAGFNLEVLESNSEKTRLFEFLSGFGLVTGSINNRSMYNKVNELWPKNDDRVKEFNRWDVKMAIEMLEKFGIYKIAEKIKRDFE